MSSEFFVVWAGGCLVSILSLIHIYMCIRDSCQEPMMVDAVTAEAADILFLNMAPLKQVQDKEKMCIRDSLRTPPSLTKVVPACFQSPKSVKAFLSSPALPLQA